MDERRDTAKVRGFRRQDVRREFVSKVPEVALGFWVIKVLATTLGEAAADVMSISLDIGRAMSGVLFLEVFAAAVAAQIAVRSFHPFLFWLVIVTAATAGTTVADFCSRSLGLGNAGGAALLLGLLVAAFALWRRSTGSLAMARISTPSAELLCWGAVLLSEALGTVLGNWVADGAGLGIDGAALVFAVGLAAVGIGYLFTAVSRTLLFWSAFVLTRPLGAWFGDWLDRPMAAGGLDLDPLSVSALLLAAMLVCIAHLSQRPARQA